MKTCPICDGEVIKIETTLSLFNDQIKINPITGYECPKCNEIFIDQEESKRIDVLTDLPIYKEKIDQLQKTQFRLRRKVGFSGRSLVVRIPKDIERVLDINDGDEIEIYPEGKNRLITKLWQI